MTALAMTGAWLLCVAPVAARADTGADDSALYRMTVAAVLAHEKPAAFAVWNQPVATAAMTQARVPRHDPDNQFVRALPKMNKRLQDALLAAATPDSAMRTLAPFTMPAIKTVAPLGFVDLPWIARQAPDQAAPPLILGVSRVAHVGNDALLYTEACLAGQDTACNGAAFWYRKAAGRWTLRQQVQLWGGGIDPFWRFAAK